MSTETKYIDIPTTGNIKKGDYLENNDALDNAFRIWISSSKNEYLRRSGGNWLLRHIGKPMNSARTQEIKRSIQTGIATNFEPRLNILDLQVVADYSKRRYIITLVAYSESLRVGINQTYLVNNEV